MACLVDSSIVVKLSFVTSRFSLCSNIVREHVHAVSHLQLAFVYSKLWHCSMFKAVWHASAVGNTKPLETHCAIISTSFIFRTDKMFLVVRSVLFGTLPTELSGPMLAASLCRYMCRVQMFCQRFQQIQVEASYGADFTKSCDWSYCNLIIVQVAK